MGKNRLSLKFSAGTCFRFAWKVSCLESCVAYDGEKLENE